MILYTKFVVNRRTYIETHRMQFGLPPFSCAVARELTPSKCYVGYTRLGALKDGERECKKMHQGGSGTLSKPVHMLLRCTELGSDPVYVLIQLVKHLDLLPDFGVDGKSEVHLTL